MDSDSVWLALALLLVFEGLLPFLSPSGWRTMIEKICKMSDGQIRFFGLCSIAVGLVSIGLLRLF